MRERIMAEEKMREGVGLLPAEEKMRGLSEAVETGDNHWRWGWKLALRRGKGRERERDGGEPVKGAEQTKMAVAQAMGPLDYKVTLWDNTLERLLFWDRGVTNRLGLSK